MKKGCGCTKGVLRYIRPPYGKMFYVPCCMHDDAYERGGDKAMRKRADRALFERMCRVVLRKEERPFKVLWMTFVAVGYYIAVRVFGRWYFAYQQS